MIEVEIDNGSGFCFGVVNAIGSAERELSSTDKLYVLGDIVHNSQEVERLQHQGLETIEHADLTSLKGKKVLLRAHGEPPSTYQIAKENDITIVDATCPVVLQLQRKIHKRYMETRSEDVQLVIYGKKGHAEVNGLVGQTDGTAIEKISFVVLLALTSIVEYGRFDLSRSKVNETVSLFCSTLTQLKSSIRFIPKISPRLASPDTL